MKRIIGSALAFVLILALAGCTAFPANDAPSAPAEGENVPTADVVEASNVSNEGLLKWCAKEDVKSLDGITTVEYGEGNESYCVWSDETLTDLWIFSVAYVEQDNSFTPSGDINVVADTFEAGSVLVFNTDIPEVLPDTAIAFKNAAGESVNYLVCYNGERGGMSLTSFEPSSGNGGNVEGIPGGASTVDRLVWCAEEDYAGEPDVAAEFGEGGESYLIWSFSDIYRFGYSEVEYNADSNTFASLTSTGTVIEKLESGKALLFHTDIPEIIPNTAICCSDENDNTVNYLVSYNGLDGGMALVKYDIATGAVIEGEQ